MVTLCYFFFVLHCVHNCSPFLVMKFFGPVFFEGDWDLCAVPHKENFDFLLIVFHNNVAAVPFPMLLHDVLATQLPILSDPPLTPSCDSWVFFLAILTPNSVYQENRDCPFAQTRVPQPVSVRFPVIFTSNRQPPPLLTPPPPKHQQLFLGFSVNPTQHPTNFSLMTPPLLVKLFWGFLPHLSNAASYLN